MHTKTHWQATSDRNDFTLNLPRAGLHYITAVAQFALLTFKDQQEKSNLACGISVLRVI